MGRVSRAYAPVPRPFGPRFVKERVLLVAEEGGGAPQEHRANKKHGALAAPRTAYQAPVLCSSPLGYVPAPSEKLAAAHSDGPVLVPVGQSRRDLPGPARPENATVPQGPPALPMELRCTTDPQRRAAEEN